MTTTKDLSLLPADKKDLYDSDAKVGTIKFTKAEKVALSQIVGTQGWDVLKNSYAKQRLVQLAVAALNMSQDVEQLFYYKGKSAEADHFIKEIESIVDKFNKDDTK